MTPCTARGALNIIDNLPCTISEKNRPIRNCSYFVEICLFVYSTSENHIRKLWSLLSFFFTCRNIQRVAGPIIEITTNKF